MGVTRRAGRKKDAVQQQAGGAPVKRDIFNSSKKKEVGLSDLTLVSKITNEAINDNLKIRFENAEIYTYIGHVLVSVNPFRNLGIYGDDTKKQYEGKNRLEAAPHVYSIGEGAYHHMQQYGDNQCVIISGESGAGKTEAAKKLMEYIKYKNTREDISKEEREREAILQRSKSISDQVLATNPLLEAFGNAKTLRNNNSSRFGKYLEMQFKSSKGQKKRRGIDDPNDASRNSVEPVGANINNYLLEKSRVVGQTLNERNFHIFYQFTKAVTMVNGRSGPSDLEWIKQYKDLYGIQSPETYQYLSQSKCLDVPGTDDIADFQSVSEALHLIRITGDDRDNLFRVLASILWLGNVTFSEDDSGNTTIRDTSVSNFLSYLLEVDHDAVVKALTLRHVETGGAGRTKETYEVPLNTVQATAVRNALAKALYFNLFDWIVQKINSTLRADEKVVDNTIGILDIYGFEIFEKNSFEQLCINYVNEKLQQIFIQLTLKAEQEEYSKEQIQWTPIKYFDNKVVCQLIEEKRPPGVLAALNDACATAHADSSAADQSFVQRVNGLSNPHFTPRQGQFVIKHYAGDVNYAIEGMTDKNKDQLLKDLLNLAASSQNNMIRNLFPDQVNQDDRRRPPTAGDKIKVSANDLVQTLMTCSPSYIRTIKPNENKSPSEYNTNNVLHQIKYLGLQENVRIRRSGFAYRQTFDKFFWRFFPLSTTISPGVEVRKRWVDQHGWDYLAGTKTILKEARIPQDQYQIGVSKVFIKDPETIFALEKKREKHFDVLVIRLQKRWRKRKGDRVTESQQLRDDGHQVLQGRKERRRFSLLGSRRFMGDYLGLNLRGGYGEFLRQSINLSGHENVLFSSRCELLVTKFGRSSKLEGRILLLTREAVYIVINTIVNQQSTLQIERRFPVAAIKYISMSTFRDDWFSLGVGSPQEPDPLLSCMFKTEFATMLTRLASRGTNVQIGALIEYNKKPGKPASVKVVRDPNAPREDFYKSGTIHTGPGEPPTSRSKPTPRSKDDDKPIEETISQFAAQPTVVQPPRSTPTPAKRSVPQTPSIHVEAVPKPQPGLNGISKQRESISARAAAPSPPPPPPVDPAAKPKKDLLKVLYDFGGGDSGFAIEKDEILESLRSEQNGWAHVQRENGSGEGWAPAAYLETYVPPAPVATPKLPPAPPSLPVRNVPPAPPQPNANGTNGAGTPAVSAVAAAAASATKGRPTPPLPPKRPTVKGKKPAPPPAPRDSAVSLSVSNGDNTSGRATPDSTDSGRAHSMAATDLASLIKARGAKMQGQGGGGGNKDDDDW